MYVVALKPAVRRRMIAWINAVMDESQLSQWERVRIAELLHRDIDRLVALTQLGQGSGVPYQTLVRGEICASCTNSASEGHCVRPAQEKCPLDSYAGMICDAIARAIRDGLLEPERLALTGATG